jgi:hypothetical protein
MAQKSFNQEENKPFDYIKEVEAAKKQEKSSADSIVTSLRSDILPASEELPESKHIFQRINLKIAVGILIGLISILLIWFFLAGPGRSGLEKKLAILVHKEATAEFNVDPSPLPATNTPPLPSITPFPSPTVLPTYTPTIKVIASPTPAIPTITPTSSSACRDALTITLADVGQTLCVQGTVIEIIDVPNSFMVIFSNKPGSFYWVSYDMVWSQAELDTCYQTTGKIEQIANSPILLFDYSNTPEVCP